MRREAGLSNVRRERIPSGDSFFARIGTTEEPLRDCLVRTFPLNCRDHLFLRQLEMGKKHPVYPQWATKGALKIHG